VFSNTSLRLPTGATVPDAFKKTIWVDNVVYGVYYFENKNWLDYSLINQIQNILEENIVNDTNSILNNDYLIKLFQLLIKSNSSDFYENRLSFFLSNLIAVILETSSISYLDHLSNHNVKKNIPSNLKVQIFYVH
jgi:hypothetical protein